MFHICKQKQAAIAAEYGDRTYGVFNVAPNTGFERDREAQLIMSYGNYHQTDDWLSFGDHTSKFAYYVSAGGNSTNWGLEPPTSVNSAQSSRGWQRIYVSAFSIPIPRTRFASMPACRLDYYQVPNDPDMQALRSQRPAARAGHFRDRHMVAHFFAGPDVDHLAVLPFQPGGVRGWARPTFR